MSIGGITGGGAALIAPNSDSAPTKGVSPHAGSGSLGSPSSGSSGNQVSVFASANGSVTTTVTDAKGNVLSSITTTVAKLGGSAGAGSALDIKA